MRVSEWVGGKPGVRVEGARERASEEEEEEEEERVRVRASS